MFSPPPLLASLYTPCQVETKLAANQAKLDKHKFHVEKIEVCLRHVSSRAASAFASLSQTIPRAQLTRLFSVLAPSPFSTLQMLIRFLDNDTLEVDQINELKDDIEYYISQVKDVEMAEIDYIYDEIEQQIREAGVRLRRRTHRFPSLFFLRHRGCHFSLPPLSSPLSFPLSHFAFWLYSPISLALAAPPFPPAPRSCSTSR